MGGYVDDEETGLYYLRNRYYSAYISRFINDDKFISTTGSIHDHNMYVYCRNSPIQLEDPSGEIAITTLILVVSAVVGAGAAAYTAKKSYDYTGEVDVVASITAGLSAFATVYTFGMMGYDFYVNCCYYTGHTPVTTVFEPSHKPVSYSHLQDPSNVGPGKDFSARQKQQILDVNRSANGGVVRSDLSGQVLVQPSKSMKGVTPAPNEWQIDHITPKSAGGTNSFSNAQVLSRYENRMKWNTIE